MLKTLKKLWNYEIGFVSRWCAGGITVGDICKASAGIPAVFGLVGAFIFLMFVVYTPHC